MKKLLIIIPIVFILIASWVLYKNSLHLASYEGLTTVPCFDPTQPIKQNYSFSLSIVIDNKPYPLESQIGHDFGKCLHVLYTNDATGTVNVRANDINTYTLGQFFDVWHKTMNKNQLIQYLGNVKVEVNGKPVQTIRDTVLSSGEQITIIYQ